MGLLFDVSVDTDSIAKAAWARAVANRERLSRRLGTQAAREEAARDQGVNTINGKPIPGMGRELFNPVVTNYRPDEPVAPPRKSEALYQVAAGEAQGEPNAGRILSVRALRGAETKFEPIPVQTNRVVQEFISSAIVRDPAAPGIPIGGSGRGETAISEQTYAFSEWSIQGDQLFALPIGGKSFIYCDYLRFWRVRNIFTRRNPGISYELTRYTFFDEDVIGVDPIPGTYSLSIGTPVIEEFLRCTLVTPNGTRRIGAPSVLKAKIRATLAPVNYTPAYAQNEPQYFDGGRIIRGIPPSGTREDLPPFFLDDFYYRSSSLSDDPAFFSSIQSNPLSALGTGAVSSLEGFFTPGIFSVINNPALASDPQVLSADLGTAEGWNLLISKLSSPRPSTAIALCALEGTCTNGRKGFDLLETPAGPSRVYRRNPLSDIDLSTTQISPNVYTWDWNNPNYCRQQVLALGFKAEDLIL